MKSVVKQCSENYDDCGTANQNLTCPYDINDDDANYNDIGDYYYNCYFISAIITLICANVKTDHRGLYSYTNTKLAVQIGFHLACKFP